MANCQPARAWPMAWEGSKRTEHWELDAGPLGHCFMYQLPPAQDSPAHGAGPHRRPRPGLRGTDRSLLAQEQLTLGQAQLVLWFPLPGHTSGPETFHTFADEISLTKGLGFHVLPWFLWPGTQ